MYSMTVFILLMTTGTPVPVKEIHKPEPFATEAQCMEYFHTPEGAARLKHISALADREFNGRELAIGFSCDKADDKKADDGKL